MVDALITLPGILLTIAATASAAGVLLLARKAQRLAAELEQTSERLRAICANPGLGVVVVDPSGNFIYANDRYLVLVDSTLEQTRRGRWIDGIHPDDRAGIRAHWKQALLTRQGFNTERRSVLHDGTVRWAQVLASPILAGNGSFRGFIALVEDVTDRRNAEAAMRESESKFYSIFHLSPQPLEVCSHEQGRYIDINQAWLKMFGFKREEVIGRTSLELGIWTDPGDRQRFIDALGDQQTFEGFECIYHTRAGQPLNCLTSGSAFTLNDEKLLIWSIVDVTLQHEAQRRIAHINEILEARVRERSAELQASNRELIRSEKLAALGSLVAGIAHELNTPIGNGVTVASTLCDHTREFMQATQGGAIKRSTLAAYVDAAQTASALLLRNLDQAHELVMSFKQVAIDQTSDQRRTFDLRTVIEEVMATLAPLTRRTPYLVSLDLATHITLDSYPGSIGQIITNFTTNALNHAFAGRASGTLRIATRALPDGWVELVFSDDGNGIPPEHLGSIFDPFFTTRFGKGGSGLGLNIVHNIATRMLGGRVDVASKPGAGTAFTLTIPLQAPRDRPPEFA